MAMFDFLLSDKKKTENLIKSELEKYVTASVKEIDEALIPIKEKLDKYKGIIVFPDALNYYPIDRPQNILRTFAKRGYLCFFCVDDEEIDVKEVEPNLFLISGQERLIPLLKDQRVLFLITYFVQYIFAKSFEKRMIWIDIMGKIDKYKYYNNYSIGIYKEIMNEAVIATYRKEEYKIYYDGVRENVKLLKDGIMTEDFLNPKKIVGDEIRRYLTMNKKTLFYYGTLNENIDYEFISKIDKLNKYVIILMGNLEDELVIREYGLKNTYIIPPKEYSYLKYYISHVDLVFFPIKNSAEENLYNKVLECSAMKKKIVSLEFDEIKNMNLPNLFIFNNNEEIFNSIENIILLKEHEFTGNLENSIEPYKWNNIIDKVF